jgi:hypothetical protein
MRGQMKKKRRTTKMMKRMMMMKKMYPCVCDAIFLVENN